MGEALLAGLLRVGKSIELVEQSSDRRGELIGRYKAVTVTAAVAEAGVAGASGVVIAVKPPDVEHVCRSLGGAGARRVLSIAAGVTTTSIEAWIGGGAAVVRAMPNTPALIGAGASAICAGGSASEADLAWAEEVLRAVGTVVRVPEAALDAITGLSGSGPAYLFLLAEALVDAGVTAGLEPDVADHLVRQTLLGSSRLLVDTARLPAELRADVTSPGGTTEAAVEAMEAAGFRSAVGKGVAAAAERSRTLGR
jgi:pyrroline-5-carboxylate reductase